MYMELRDGAGIVVRAPNATRSLDVVSVLLFPKQLPPAAPMGSSTVHQFKGFHLPNEHDYLGAFVTKSVHYWYKF